jgi:hypothetical protein
MAGGKESPYRNISDRAAGVVVILGRTAPRFKQVMHCLGWVLAALYPYKLFGSRTDLLSLAKGSPELDTLHDRFLSSLAEKPKTKTLFKKLPLLIFSLLGRWVGVGSSRSESRRSAGYLRIQIQDHPSTDES